MEQTKDILYKIFKEIFQEYDYEFEIEDDDEVNYFIMRIKSKTTDVISNEYKIAMPGNGTYIEPILLYSKSSEEYEEIGTYHLIEKTLKLNRDFWKKMFICDLFRD